MERLKRSFFDRYTPDVARGLLGTLLVRVVEGRRLSGMVVETEAYRGISDPASHAFRGRTRRNEVMFGRPGCAYVYFTMGLHYCLNVTTESAGTPGAVLIRAVDPVEGLDLMARNRGVGEASKVTSGPANLTKAMAIGLSLNGEDLVVSSELFLEKWKHPVAVGITSRIGITKGTGRRWRFFFQGNPSVSKARPPAIHPRTHN